MQPPQTPYEGFPNPNDPVPPYGSGVPARGPEISFDVISQAWTVLQSNIGTYIGATLILVLVNGLFQGIQFALTPRSPSGQQEFSVLPLIVGLIGWVASQLLAGGFIRMAINHLKSGRPDLSQMFSTTDVLPSLLGASILMALATVLGFCACIIPGLLLSGLFMFVNPLIVDRHMGVFDAMGTSFNTLKPQMWTALLFVLVIGLIAGAGALACIVGLFITVPLAILSIAITYRNFFPDGSNGFQFPTNNYPTAPIADPRG